MTQSTHRTSLYILKCERRTSPEPYIDSFLVTVGTPLLVQPLRYRTRRLRLRSTSFISSGSSRVHVRPQLRPSKSTFRPWWTVRLSYLVLDVCDLQDLRLHHPCPRLSGRFYFTDTLFGIWRRGRPGVGVYLPSGTGRLRDSYILEMEQGSSTERFFLLSGRLPPCCRNYLSNWKLNRLIKRFSLKIYFFW